MNNASNDPKPPKRNITWQVQRDPAECEHEYEVFAHEDGGTLARCAKCGSLEAE